MAKQLFIGIDPGSSGGIAITDGEIPQAWPMPAIERETYDLLRELIDQPHPVFAVIEKVWALPGGGERKSGAVSMFSFGQSYGFLRGLLTAMKIPFDEVRPQEWQKYFGLIVRKEKLTQTEKKNRNKQKAQQLFPFIKCTHAISDALLIAEYARREHGNTATK